MIWITLLIVSSLVSSALCEDSCIVKLTGQTNYTSDERLNLTCKQERTGNPVDKIEIRETHGLIYYENKAHNTTNFKACDEYIPTTEGSKVYTYGLQTRLNMTFDGKTFTCQCGASTSSLTINVTDAKFGDGSGTSTDVTAKVASGAEWNYSKDPPTYLETCGELGNVISIERTCEDKYVSRFVNFTKPPACKRNVALRLWMDQPRLCEREVNATSVNGDVYSYNITETDWPTDCIDVCWPIGWNYIVELSSDGYWLEQTRINDTCLYTPDPTPFVLGKIGCVLIIIMCIVIVLVCVGFLVILYKKKHDVQDGQKVPETLEKGIALVPIVVICIGVVALVLLVAITIMWATTPCIRWSDAGVVLITILAALLLVGLVLFIVVVVKKFKLCGNSRRWLMDDVDGKNEQRVPEGFDGDSKHIPMKRIDADGKGDHKPADGGHRKKGRSSHQTSDSGHPVTSPETGDNEDATKARKSPRQPQPRNGFGANGPTYTNHGYERNGSVGSTASSGDVTPTIQT